MELFLPSYQNSSWICPGILRTYFVHVPSTAKTKDVRSSNVSLYSDHPQHLVFICVSFSQSVYSIGFKECTEFKNAILGPDLPGHLEG
jgi:hypothetical protein